MNGRFFFSSRSRHTQYWRDWSSDVCSADLPDDGPPGTHRRAVGDRVHAAVPRLSLPRGPRQLAPAVRHPARVRPDAAAAVRPDWKSVVQGKSVDLGGRRIIIKKTYVRPPTL